ncbi:MAG: lipid-transfer protein [Gammaproteobacteria bacterium]
MSSDFMPVRDRTAIVGIGSTEYAKNIGRTEQQTCIEAVHKAAADAGLSTRDIDGIFRVDMDPNIEPDLARALGIRNLRAWASYWGGGGAACAPVIGAALAVASGMANVAVAIRSRNRGSGGRPWARQGAALRIPGPGAFEFPYGVFSPVCWIALAARTYMHRHGATPATFARVAVAQRANAVYNPNAVYRTPITVEDVLASRMIADPLHLLDCCPEMDGAQAVIVTSRERARDLRQPPALLAGLAQGTNGRAALNMSGVYPSDPLDYAAPQAAADIYRMAGIGPRDIDCAMLYDMFSPVVLFGLETWGFCKRGEAGAFVESGGIDWNGALPVNTHGGSLSETYLHGFNHILEGVRQVRGTSTRQLSRTVNNVLVTAAPIAPTSAIILRRDAR